jgi:DNA-binding transcriptional ArsR family regulator
MRMTGDERRTPRIPADRAGELAALFAALGEPTRLRIVSALAGGEAASVQELAARAGASLANVSKHLQVLYQGGVVSRRRAGSFVHYRLRDERILQLLELASEATAAGASVKRRRVTDGDVMGLIPRGDRS